MLQHAAESARFGVCLKSGLAGTASLGGGALHAYKGRPKPPEPKTPAPKDGSAPKDAPAPPPKPAEPPK
jgi:hypothetical protein